MSKRYIFSLFASLFVCFTLCGQSIDKEVVAFQMNSCVMSLTNLNESQSLATYEKERENLINNLSKEGMAKLPEITDLRESILSTIYQLEITQEERQVLRKIKAIDKEGDKWRAISNGLNQAMVFIPGRSGGGAQQAAFYALLTAARSAVDYGASQKEAESEEAKALWEIRKQDLKQYAWLNTEAYKKINEIFRLYQLGDEYELTPRQASEFNKLISDQDPVRRSQKLINNASIFRYLNEYNYYLGMAFLQQNDFKKAKPYFDSYIANARKSRIYKIDDKLGCIYLALLAYEEMVPASVTERYVSEALKNLPHNGAAYIQCATIFCSKLQSKEMAFTLLRDALFDDMMTEKEAIIMTITEWLPQIKESPSYNAIYNSICQSIEANIDYVSLNSYLHFLIASEDTRSWEEIEKLLCVTGEGNSVNVKEPFLIRLTKNLDIKIDHLSVYVESLKGDVFKVKEASLTYPHGFTQAKLEKKFALFKASPDLIYLFFDYNKDGNVFYVKRSITKEDFNKLTKTPYEYEGIKSFSLDLTDKSSPDRKSLQKIVDFCRKNQALSPSETIVYCKVKRNKQRSKEVKSYLDNHFQSSSSLSFVPFLLPPVDTGKIQYSYELKLSQQKGSSYCSDIHREYNRNHIRLFIKGTESKDIQLLYQLIDGDARLVAYGNGDGIVMRHPISILPSEDIKASVGVKKEKKSNKQESGPNQVSQRKNFIEWVQSIFTSSKSEKGASDKVSEEKKDVQSSVKERKRSKKERVNSGPDKSKKDKVKSQKEKSPKLQPNNDANNEKPRKSFKEWWHSIFHKKDKSE